MTTELTKAAQQAIEALKNVTDYDQINAARRALQSALTQRPAAQEVNERAVFEAWIKKHCGDLSTFGTGPNRHYVNSAVNNAWIALFNLLSKRLTPATPEPVGEPWGWAIEDKHGVAQAVRPARKEFFGCVQSTDPFTAEDIAKMDREWAGLAPHRIVTLYTRPAPGVPDVEDLRDRLVAISSAVAHSDDRAAQSMLSETLRLLAAQAKGAGHA